MREMQEGIRHQKEILVATEQQMELLVVVAVADDVLIA
jgi:hypothetical protein